MGLNDIMIEVLKNEGAMRPNELAEYIRVNMLYTQRNGTQLKNQQIYARRSNYPNLFKLYDGMIMLQDIDSIAIPQNAKKIKTIFDTIANFNADPLLDWFHESKISTVLVGYLKDNGYTIINDHSDHISNKGIDIIVKKGSIVEFIEVKGYPSIYYVNKSKQGQQKKTKPNLQSTHWFDGCLSSTIKNYNKGKENLLAMAFPACPRYEQIMYTRQEYFTENNLDIKVYFVKKDGSVVIDNMNRKLGIKREDI